MTDSINEFLLVLLSGIPCEPYNIGNTSPEISMKDLAKEISKELDNKQVEFEIVTALILTQQMSPTVVAQISLTRLLNLAMDIELVWMRN